MASDKDFEALGAVADDEFLNLGAEPESLSIEQETPKMNALEAGLTGLKQGGTLGFSDELSGLTGATLDKSQQLLNTLTGGKVPPSPTQIVEQLKKQGITGDLGPESTLDLYKQMRDEERQTIKKSQQDQPMASLAGNIAGGLVLPLGALSAPLKVGKNAGIVEAVTKGALNAAPIGALAGAGLSEADATKGDLKQLSKDVTSDALLGASLGAAGPLLSKSAKGIGNTVKESQVMQDLLDAYKVGKEKINLSSPEFLTQSRDKLKQLAGKADDEIRQKSESIFKSKKAKLKELENLGVKADVKDELQIFANEVNSSTALRDEEKQIINNVINTNFEKGFVKGPQELENLLKDFKDLKKNVQTPSGMDAVNRAINSLKGKQDSMDESLKEFNRQAFNVIDAGEALTKKNPLDYMTSKGELGTKESMANMLEKMSSDYKTQSFLDDILNKGLETSKSSKIMPLSESVPEAAKAIQQAKPISRQMDLAKGAQSPTFQGTNIFDSASNALTSGGTKAMNKLGMGVKESQDFLTKGVRVLSNADGNQLQKLINKLEQAGGKGLEYGKVLSTAIGKNPQSKNAIIFGLMQQPEFRELFHKSNTEEIEDGQ